MAVLGGGIIGLAVAWRASQRGMSVLLVERDGVGCGASPVAAGMLAPVTEVELGEAGRRALELASRSAALWPDFAAELEELTGNRVGFRRAGTLMVARDADEARELERQLAFRESLGARAIRLRPSEAREREPALAPTVRLALEAPDDHSVDPRLVLLALRDACERAGVEIIDHADQAAPVESPGRPTQLSPAKEMKMEMGHLGSGVSSYVERQPVATAQNAFPLGHRPRCHQHLRQKFAVLRAHFRCVGDMYPGNDEHVNGGHWPQVVEGVRVLPRVRLS